MTLKYVDFGDKKPSNRRKYRQRKTTLIRRRIDDPFLTGFKFLKMFREKNLTATYINVGIALRIDFDVIIKRFAQQKRRKRL